MKNFVMHPEIKRVTLGFYLLIYRDRNEVLIKHGRLLRVSKATLSSQTSSWPELQKFLVSRRKRILKGHRFAKFEVKDLAQKSPDEILAAITKS